MNQSESSSTDAEGENTHKHTRADASATAVSDIPGLQMNVSRRHVLVTARPHIKFTLPNLLPPKWDFN